MKSFEIKKIFSSGKIFRRAKFLVGENFGRGKFFVGENFRHLQKILSFFPDEIFPDKVLKKKYQNIMIIVLIF